MPLADVFSALPACGPQILQSILPFPPGRVLHIRHGSPPGESVVLWDSLLRQRHVSMLQATIMEQEKKPWLSSAAFKLLNAL